MVILDNWQPDQISFPRALAAATATVAASTRGQADLHNDEIVHLDGSPPMFFFADPDGNGFVSRLIFGIDWL